MQFHRHKILVVRGDDQLPQLAWHETERPAPIAQSVAVVNQMDANIANLEHKVRFWQVAIVALKVTIYQKADT
jgi:hypothetical protein